MVSIPSWEVEGPRGREEGGPSHDMWVLLCSPKPLTSQAALAMGFQPLDLGLLTAKVRVWIRSSTRTWAVIFGDAVSLWLTWANRNLEL